jgi:hypothetical protein
VAIDQGRAMATCCHQRNGASSDRVINRKFLRARGNSSWIGKVPTCVAKVAQAAPTAP